MLFNLRREDRPWNIIPKALTSKKNRKKNYDEIKAKFVEKKGNKHILKKLKNLTHRK